MQESELQRLVDDVKAGRCALILGPEIFTTENGQGIQAYIRAQLSERFGEQIAAYYERDGFFLLKNPEDKPEMQDEVQHLYKSLRPAEDLLRQIVEVPFSLVLSVNPDTWLRDLSFRYGLPNRFAWFDPRKQEDLDVPDGSEAGGQALRDRIPLYYNLCGSVDRLSTLLLDYDDLYRLLEGMLGAPKLPEKLLARLKDTTSYLFLGFQFDRWHTQLMLRLLDVKKAPRRFAIQSPVPKEKDTEAFVISQFRIKFLGEEADVLHRVHAAFAAEGLLRPVDENGAPARLEVTAYLQKGNLEKALARLQDASKGSEVADTATLLSSQYQLWLGEKNKGTLDTRDIALQFNQLTDRILQAAKLL